MKYRRTNTLGLAVLGLLWERDMHPYEMASTLRERHQEASVKLNYGSLYTVVEALLKHDLVHAVGTLREGNRPERTVYGLTDTGRAELHDWLRELIAEPTKEYPRFEAGVALIGLLPPDEAIELCERRAETLDAQLVGLREVMTALGEQGLPQLAWIELEYRLAMARAERDWVRWFAAAARAGELGGQEFWRDLHAGDRAGNVRTTKEDDRG
ncbi:DNA-binding PadR family transcriptional regulator [Umezawaea tangerina]|uniref:DNA-binding PadR family transcriptional regulator n=1 Tax=Umezawaea tangerina TaxID=84725 RepID=A0A2T0SR09_9PSEU|nr:DNA-binding PadR family transcriptional regulator [Umezawaea tangerina]